MNRLWTKSDLFSLSTQLCTIASADVNHICQSIDEFFLEKAHPLYLEEDLVNEVLRLLKSLTMLEVTDDRTMKISYSLIKLSSHLLGHVLKEEQNLFSILDCVYLLLNPKAKLYSSSNQFCKHDALWMYIKKGMVVEYKNTQYTVNSINAATQTISLLDKKEQLSMDIPLYSSDIQVKESALLEAYQDWIADLHYGDVADVFDGRSFTKGYYIREDDFGGKTFLVNNGLGDLPITVNPVNPSRVTLHNTVEFSSFIPLQKTFFYLPVNRFSNNQISSTNNLSLGPIACHNDSPLFIYALHCIEENHFFSSVLSLLQRYSISASDFSNIIDIFSVILPFFFKERYETLLSETRPVFLTVFSNLLKNEVLKAETGWKVAALLQGANPMDHLTLLASMLMEYIHHDSREYSAVASSMIKEVIDTLFHYGAKMNVSMRKICEYTEINQATDLINHFTLSLLKKGILSHSVTSPYSQSQRFGTSFLELILSYGSLHSTCYPVVWDCFLELIEKNDYQMPVTLLILLHDKDDMSLDYFFGNILKYCLTHEWSVEIDFFTSLLESWTEFKQVEEMISLYRHCLQKMNVTFINKDYLQQMSPYLDKFYHDLPTMLNTSLSTIQEHLLTNKNPAYEMTLLYWLVDRHFVLQNIQQVDMLLGIAKSFIASSHLEYLHVVVSLITNSFHIIRNLSDTIFNQFWYAFTQYPEYPFAGIFDSLIHNANPSIHKALYHCIITSTHKDVFTDITLKDYEALLTLWLSVYKNKRHIVLDDGLFHSILDHASESVATRCCYDWGRLCCEVGIACNQLFTVCLNHLQALFTKYQASENSRLLYVMESILVHMHSIAPWDNLDMMQKDTKFDLVHLKNTQSSMSLCLSKPLYLLLPQLSKQCHMPFEFFHVFLSVDGQDVLVEPWKTLQSYDCTQYSITCSSCTHLYNTFKPVVFESEQLQQLQQLCFLPLLTVLKENKAESTTVWSLLNGLPMASSFYDKKVDVPTVSINTYSTLLASDITTLPYAIKVLTALTQSTIKPVQGTLLQLIQPLVICYSTIAMHYEANPTQCQSLTVLLSTLAASLLKTVLRNAEGSYLYLRYKTFVAWLKDTTSDYVGQVDPIPISVMDSDYALILDLLYNLNTTPKYSNKCQATIDRSTFQTLITTVTCLAFASSIRSRELLIQTVTSLIETNYSLAFELIWSLASVLMSDKQLLASYISNLILHDRTSTETRLLNAFIEKKIVSEDQLHTILKNIVDQLEAAEDTKKIDVIMNHKGTLTRLIKSGLKNEAVQALYEQMIGWLFSMLPTENDSYTIAMVIEILQMLIEEVGLTDSSRKALESLAEIIYPIEVTKASDVSDHVKSPHAGMRNLGCICYLLSVMQQFFMIPAFRQGILETHWTGILAKRTRREGDEEHSNLTPEDIDGLHSLLDELQNMFKQLLLNQGDEIDPTAWCDLFKDETGCSISIYNQEDAHEYLAKFIARIESALQYTDHPTLISELFEGEMSDQLRCPNCGIIRDKRTPFTNISLESSDHGTLLQSLEQYSTPEIINDYKCEKCNQRVDIEKTSCIIRIPTYFIIQLKLFEFDFMYMQRRKLKPTFSFPFSVNFQASVPVVSDATYTLKGTVMHMGSADSGHYFSFIRDDEQEGGNWNEFNDELVSPYDKQNLVDAFEKNINSYQSRQSYATPYLLFYENTSAQTFPIKTADELFPEDSTKQQTSKKVYMRLIGLEQWPALLMACFTADPTNLFVIQLLIQYMLQVALVVRKTAIQTELEPLLSHKAVLQQLVPYACDHHIIGRLLYQHRQQLYGFDLKLYEAVLSSTLEALRTKSDLTIAALFTLSSDLFIPQIFSLQFENETYRSLLSEVLKQPPVLACFFAELYPTFLQTLSRYQVYRPEICKEYYTLLASACANAQALQAVYHSLSSTQLYLGARREALFLTKHAQDQNLTVHVECVDSLPLDQLSSQLAHAIVIIPSDFISEVISESFIISLLRVGARNSLLSLLLATCRSNPQDAKQMVETMKGVVARVANRAETLQFVCLLIEFLGKKDPHLQLELMALWVKKPEPVWEYGTLSPVQKLDIITHMFIYIQAHPEWNILDADELIKVERLVSTIPNCMDKEKTLAAIQAIKK